MLQTYDIDFIQKTFKYIMPQTAAELPREYSLVQRLTAEFLGTFGLIFAALGAIAMDGFSGGNIGHGGVAAAFGLAVMSMIYTFGGISGAHINPAVTIGFALAGRFRTGDAAAYIAAQVLGGTSGEFALQALFGRESDAGLTLPHIGIGGSFALEILLTGMLMLLILRVSRGAREEGLTAAIAIGGYVGLAALWAGPACGASMNPVRSLAPALSSQHFDDLWIYLIAPVVGAALAVLLDRMFSANTERTSRTSLTQVPDPAPQK